MNRVQAANIAALGHLFQTLLTKRYATASVKIQKTCPLEGAKEPNLAFEKVLKDLNRGPRGDVHRQALAWRTQ